jgi:hypothetical protein
VAIEAAVAIGCRAKPLQQDLLSQDEMLQRRLCGTPRRRGLQRSLRRRQSRHLNRREPHLASVLQHECASIDDGADDSTGDHLADARRVLAACRAGHRQDEERHRRQSKPAQMIVESKHDTPLRGCRNRNAPNTAALRPAPVDLKIPDRYVLFRRTASAGW